MTNKLEFNQNYGICEQLPISLYYRCYFWAFGVVRADVTPLVSFTR